MISMQKTQCFWILAQPTGVWTNVFGYDFANRLNGVVSPAGTFTYTYDQPSTRLTGLTLPNGAYVVNQFDTMSRLTNTYLFSSVPAALDGHVYQYDRENQRTSETRVDSSTVAYSYDNIGQLKIADSSVPAEDRGYFYDAAWNLNRRTNNGTASQFKVNVLNELTNAPSPVGNQTYDSNGNLLTNHVGAHSKWIYYYDDENRLIELIQTNGISLNSIKATDFIYDGLGRLRERLEYIPTPGSSPVGDWMLSSETHYIYDGMRVIQERDGNNVPTVSYTRGNDLSVSLEGAGGIGGLLARSSGYSAGNWTSHADYYADGNGNITSLIDGNQAVVASYRYDPFGNIISKSGTLADANVYRFSSKEVHVNSGMYYYGFRFYDPNLQRWINRDPIEEEGGINLYGFCLNDPSDFVDVNGDNIFTKITKTGVIKVLRTKTAHQLLKKGKNLCFGSKGGGKAALKREVQKAMPDRGALYHTKDSTARSFGGEHAQPNPRRGNNSHLFNANRANYTQLRDAARMATAGFWVDKATGAADEELSKGQKVVADGLGQALDAISPLSCANDLFELGNELGDLLDEL